MEPQLISYAAMWYRGFGKDAVERVWVDWGSTYEVLAFHVPSAMSVFFGSGEACGRA